MTNAQRWGWGLLTVLITLSILFLLMLKAEAGGYCQQGGGHCDTTTTTDSTSSTTTIQEETTTTIEEPSTTSTSIGSTTTTTAPPATSSTAPSDNTTTTTDPLLTLWTAGAQCQTLHADFGTGITQVDVYWRDPILGDFGPADGLTSFTESGQEMETGVNAEFILIPVVESGWTAVPDQISLFTEHCSPGPPTTTTDPTTNPPELPLTGTGTKALVAIAAAVSTLGFMAVKEAGRE